MKISDHSTKSLRLFYFIFANSSITSLVIVCIKFNLEFKSTSHPVFGTITTFLMLLNSNRLFLFRSIIVRS